MAGAFLALGTGAFLPAASAMASNAPCINGAPNVCILGDNGATETLIALMVPVGATMEGHGEYGVAHYLEHLAFRDRSVESGEPSSGGVGIDRFGNAYTTPFATTYYWTVPPERAGEAIGRALRVLAPLDVPGTVIDQERAIVQREREQRMAAADAKRGAAIDAALYSGTPLARTVIGTREDVDALTGEVARAFHEKHYDPATATLVVAGAVDHGTVAATVADARATLGLSRPRPTRRDGAGDTNGGGPASGTANQAPAGNATEASPDGASVAARFGMSALAPRALVHLGIRGPFGAPERTMEAMFVRMAKEEADDDADARVLAASGMLEAFLGSGLDGSPRVALEKGRDRVSEAVGDDVRKAGFSVREVTPGLLSVGITIGLRPTVEAERVVPALDAAWEAWEAEWSALRDSGLPPEAFERLHARMVDGLARERADGVAAAWSLIGWLEAGSDPDAWAGYPATVDALAPADVDGLLERLGAPTRAVMTDTVPASGGVTVRLRYASGEGPREVGTNGEVATEAPTAARPAPSLPAPSLHPSSQAMPPARGRRVN